MICVLYYMYIDFRVHRYWTLIYPSIMVLAIIIDVSPHKFKSITKFVN